MSREKIIDAAVCVFSKVGYHRASMDEIARTADVAKGTLYYHFSSKAELFKALATEGFMMITDRIKEELKDDSPVEIQLRKIIEANIQLYLEYSELARIFFNEISSGIDADVLAEIEALRSGYTGFIADLLKSASAQEDESSTHYELVAAGILGLLDATCKYYLMNKETIQPDEIGDFITDILSVWLNKENR